MITDLSYDEFCNRYYLSARRNADYVMAEFIKKNGELDPSLDPDLIKDVAISLSLQKAYDRFDSDHGKKASVETFLSTIIHNQIMTELRKEGKAVGAGKKDSLDATNGKGAYRGGDISADESDETNRMRLRLAECVEQLDPIKRTIIDCWMENQRGYCDDALYLLGWGPERRQEVKDLKAQTLVLLQEMMKEEERTDKKTKQPREAPQEKKPEPIVYEHDIPLKNLKAYVEYIKEYFGLFHPSLEPELSLLKYDPERTFKLYEFVLHENIETAFAEGGFSCNVELSRTYVDFLWLVANLYYGQSYQAYQAHFNDIVSNELVWKEVREDILRFYSFMQDCKEEAPITIKVGKKKVVINDTERWFQALMENHLFPKCLPDISSKEQAQKILKKDSGRRVENELAIAIINGVASLFADNELIKGRAPKNLCTFIRKYLILMNILEVNDSIIREENIKSAINYAVTKEGDARLRSTDLRNASLEDLASVGVIPEERWLFTKEI